MTLLPEPPIHRSSLMTPPQVNILSSVDILRKHVTPGAVSLSTLEAAVTALSKALGLRTLGDKLLADLAASWWFLLLGLFVVVVCFCCFFCLVCLLLFLDTSWWFCCYFCLLLYIVALVCTIVVENLVVFNDIAKLLVQLMVVLPFSIVRLSHLNSILLSGTLLSLIVALLWLLAMR